MSSVPKKFTSAYQGPLKDWRAEYDQVIALRLAGHPVEAIAEVVKYHPDHVRRILRDPRAKQALKVLRKRMMGRTLKAIGDMMVNLAPRALENIQKTIDHNPELGSKAKVHQDTVSFELLARVGFDKKGASQEGEKAPQLPKELAEALVTAIERADRAREIKELPEVEAAVE